MPFLVDTFTDTDNTDLPDHTPDTGGAWVEMGFRTANDDFSVGSTDGINVIASNRIDASTVTTRGTAVCRNAADPGGAEYDIFITHRTDTSARSNQVASLFARMSPTGTSHADVDRYEFLFRNQPGGDAGWEIVKVVGGTITSLDFVNEAITDTWWEIWVEVRDGKKAIHVREQGSGTWIEKVSTSDNAITQNGRVGLVTNRLEFGRQIFDDLSAEAVGGGPTTYALTTNTSGNGSVGRDPDEAEFEEDDSVTLTATPDSGWEADDPLWSGDGIDGSNQNDNPLTYTMPGSAATVTANFVESAADPPDAPANLGADTVPAVELSWDSVAGTNITYDVERDSSVVASGLTATEFRDDDVTVDTQYSYRVRTDEDGTKGDWTAAVEHTPALEAAEQTEFVWDGTQWV